MRVRLFAGVVCAGSALIAIGSIAWSRTPFSPSPSMGESVVAVPAEQHSTIATNATVIYAVDGDTLRVRLDGVAGEKHVRLLGINTPETVDPRKPVECFGKEASARMRTLVDGKRVRLDADPQADERDIYDRLLRNVTLADGRDLNASLVRDGFAYAYLSFPLNPHRKRELRQLQEAARIGQRGLWNPTSCNGHR